MELWIRTQNKKQLIKCENIYVSEYGYTSRMCGIYADSIKLGDYEAVERALEILDEISFGVMYCGLPYNEIKALANKEKIKLQGNFVTNPNTNMCIYQMPEE